MSESEDNLDAEYAAMTWGSDRCAYLGTLLRHYPLGASKKMLTNEMRSLCSDPYRQIKYNPFQRNNWDFALDNCERLSKWPNKNVFVVIQYRAAGNGGPHTGFRVLTYHGLVRNHNLCYCLLHVACLLLPPSYDTTNKSILTQRLAGALFCNKFYGGAYPEVTPPNGASVLKMINNHPDNPSFLDLTNLSSDSEHESDRDDDDDNSVVIMT
jgi:hypothetical protein